MSLFETFTKGQMDAQAPLNRNFAIAEAQLSNKANIGPLEWVSLPLADGYMGAARYAISSDRRVWLEGQVLKSPGVAVPVHTVFAVLPESFRPSSLIIIPVIVINGSGASQTKDIGGLRVERNGEISLEPIGNTTSITSGSPYLFGVSYLT